MDGITTTVKVKIGIEQGSVYNFAPKDVVPNHYFIVLNKNPKRDSEIHLAPFTTKRGKILNFISLQKLSTETFVEIKEDECVFLPRREESCVDCNRLIKISLENLIELIDSSNGSCNYPKVEEALLERVIKGVRASRMVSTAIKATL